MIITIIATLMIMIMMMILYSDNNTYYITLHDIHTHTMFSLPKSKFVFCKHDLWNPTKAKRKTWISQIFFCLQVDGQRTQLSSRDWVFTVDMSIYFLPREARNLANHANFKRAKWYEWANLVNFVLQSELGSAWRIWTLGEPIGVFFAARSWGSISEPKRWKIWSARPEFYLVPRSKSWGLENTDRSESISELDRWMRHHLWRTIPWDKPKAVILW